METYIRFNCWNRYAKRFVNAPTFTWEPVKKAARYRVGVASASEREAAWYETEDPSFSLADVWTQLPFGRVDMVILPANDRGEEVEAPVYADNMGYKAFVKSPGWKGAKEQPLDWDEPIRRNIEWLLQPPRDRVEAFEVGLPKHVWSCLENAYTGERHIDGKPADMFSFPSMHFPYMISAFLSFARAFQGDPLAKEAHRQALQYGEWLLNNHHPEGYACSAFPISCLAKGELRESSEPGRTSGSETITVFRVGAVGEAMLYLGEVESNPAYIQYALHLADGLLRLQKDDGSWPFRVSPQTGEVVHGYTSDVVTPARFLALAYQKTSDPRYKAGRDRATNWLMENPVRNHRWEGQFEDIAEQPPYADLQHYDVQAAIRYLIYFRDEIKDAVPAAVALNEFVEDQFVVWQTGDPAIAIHCPTPAVLEQYVCYYPMECYNGLWLESLMALHWVTGQGHYLDKAIAAANAICRSQLPSGAITTWGYDLRFGRPLLARPQWYAIDAVAFQALIRLKAYLAAISEGKPWAPVLNEFHA